MPFLGVAPDGASAVLQLSIKTVSTYRARVLEKMQMRTTAEIMRYAIENGLTDS